MDCYLQDEYLRACVTARACTAVGLNKGITKYTPPIQMQFLLASVFQSDRTLLISFLHR